MAQEASKAKPAVEPAPAAGGSSGLSGWMPVIAVLVLVPVLSFVMAEFVLFPRLEQRLVAAGVKSPGETTPGAEAPEAHGEDGAKGEGEGTMKFAYEFKDVMSNLAGAMKTRYIKVTFTTYGSDPKFPELMEQNRAKLLDATLTVLLSLNLTDLEDPALKKKVGMLLMQQFQTVLRHRVVEELYFSDFLIQ